MQYTTKLFVTDDPELKIYFRVPFFGYFVGREHWGEKSMVRGRRHYEWSPLFLYRKVFDDGDYFFMRV